MHPPVGEQLTHAGVHEGVSGAALAPGLEALAGLVHAHPVELVPQVLPGGLGAVPQHVGVELAPAQLAAEPLDGAGHGRRAQRTEIGEQRPRVDLAVLQVRGERGRAVDVRPVAALVRTWPGRSRGRRASVASPPPRRPRAAVSCPGPARPGAPRCRRPAPTPRPSRRARSVPAPASRAASRPGGTGLKTWYAAPPRRVIVPGPTAYGGAGRHQRAGRRGRGPPPPPRRGAARTDRRRPLTCTRVAPTCAASAGTTSCGRPCRTTRRPASRLSSARSDADQPRPARRPGRVPELRVDDEQRHDGMPAAGVGDGGEQRGVVGQAQIAAEPQHGRHASDRSRIAFEARPGGADNAHRPNPPRTVGAGGADGGRLA